MADFVAVGLRLAIVCASLPEEHQSPPSGRRALLGLLNEKEKVCLLARGRVKDVSRELGKLE
jgi:hypothetical protein